MCFSPEASFIVGAALVAGGAFCVKKAINTDRRYVPMALFPIFAGVQQIAEGAVWTGLAHDCGPAITGGSYTFLFFAWMMWSFWVPFMVWMVETDKAHKRLLTGYVIAGGIWGALMYLPYFFQTESITPIISNNAIYYQHLLWLDHYMPREASGFVYLTIIGSAPIAASNIWVKLFGVGLFIVAQLSYILFYYALASIMCFFAAILTVYLFYIIARDKCALRSAD